MTIILDSDRVLNEGVRALKRKDPVMKRIIGEGATPPLRKRDPGFEGLAGIIVSQQLSVASAGAIWARFKTRFDPLTPEAVLAASDDELRGPGLSAP
ncbi:MAG TPA: DNA-3-methyladenine glycosylase 2 family protein, partial [Beijerinckiaceae bacterium]|nr:DNA-3-methyladenine glycosylase 2 family protein [Beijerinckiaceae bacterium]